LFIAIFGPPIERISAETCGAHQPLNSRRHSSLYAYISIRLHNKGYLSIGTAMPFFCKPDFRGAQRDCIVD
jgi:hypothetical protein